MAFAGHESPELAAAIDFIKKEPVRGFFSRSFLALRNYFSAIRVYFRHLLQKEENDLPSQHHPNDKMMDFKDSMHPDNYSDNPNNYPCTNLNYQSPSKDDFSDKDIIK